MKLRSNVPLSSEELPRKKWLFNQLKVGRGSIDIEDKSEWIFVQRQAHAYAAHKNPRWKLFTRWLKEEGVGRIRRVK
jgi:hypothetical protein